MIKQILKVGKNGREKKCQIGKEEDLGREYVRLIWVANSKRNRLLDKTRRNLNIKKILTITSGISSLISALTLAAVIVKYVPQFQLSVIALILAFSGGILAIIGTFIFNYRELFNLYLGASRFLALRENLSCVAIDKDLSYRTRKKRMADLQSQYTELSETYDHYIKVDEAPSSPVIQFGYEIAKKHVGEEKMDNFHRDLFDDFFKETGIKNI